MTISLPTLLNQTELAVKEAGEFARNAFQNFSRQQVEYKGKNDLFSYVDVQTEQLLKEKLGTLLPGAGFIGEETADAQAINDYTWIVDPIDGTTNFVHGIPMFAISVALRQGTEVVLGIVYEVIGDELFAAYKGGGATLNGEAIQVSECKVLAESLIGTGFPKKGLSSLDEYLKLVAYMLAASHGIRRMGSAAIDLVYVACGRLEGFFEWGLNPWDVAAGALIVQEAGGIVSDFKGGNDYLFGKQIIASNGHIQEDLEEVIKANERMIG